jgi:hypothetical protein
MTMPEFQLLKLGAKTREGIDISRMEDQALEGGDTGQGGKSAYIGTSTYVQRAKESER